MGNHNIPFSWEHAPGICKVGGHKECPKGGVAKTLQVPLPPPPCPSDRPKLVGHGLQIPLPPCPFQPPFRCPSNKGLTTEDPFLAAYVNCTKSSRRDGLLHGNKKSKKKHSMHLFSCKHSCGVREDSLVRFPRVLPPAERERGREMPRTRSLH